MGIKPLSIYDATWTTAGQDENRKPTKAESCALAKRRKMREKGGLRRLKTHWLAIPPLFHLHGS
jgi:hypothetical protein